jgi:hypothetical protein
VKRDRDLQSQSEGFKSKINNHQSAIKARRADWEELMIDEIPIAALTLPAAPAAIIRVVAIGQSTAPEQ